MKNVAERSLQRFIAIFIFLRENIMNNVNYTVLQSECHTNNIDTYYHGVRNFIWGYIIFLSLEYTRGKR